jgi:hypothetical protein
LNDRAGRRQIVSVFDLLHLSYPAAAGIYEPNRRHYSFRVCTSQRRNGKSNLR